MQEKLDILRLAGGNTLVIKKSPSSSFFITTKDSVIIGTDGFVFLLNFLVKNGFIHQSILEGILEEANTE